MKPQFLAPKHFLRFVPAAVFFLLAIFFAIKLQSPEKITVASDRPLPSFDLPALMPEKPAFTNRTLAGQVAVINVFASWCLPCRAEHPLLSAFEQMRIPVYGIAYKDKPEAVRAYLHELGDPYAAVGQDAAGQTAIELGLSGVPETYIIDRAGHVRYHVRGPLTPDLLREEVLPLLEKLGQ